MFFNNKDHQPNFENNATATKLFNPAQNEIGRISKAILENINKELGSQLQVFSQLVFRFVHDIYVAIIFFKSTFICLLK